MKTAEFFDKRSGEWSDLYAQDSRFARRYSRIASFFEKVLPREVGRALDVGCGSGVFSRLLATQGWRVTAIDLSEEMIAQAVRAQKSANNPLVDFEVCSIDDYPVSPGSYSALISLSALEYVEDDEMAMAKFGSLLMPGGVLVVSVPNRSGLVRKFEGLIFGIRKASRGRFFANRGEYLLHQKQQYTALELDLRMRQHGLRKKRGIYLNAGFSPPEWMLSLFERKWWATMYCAAYVKK